MHLPYLRQQLWFAQWNLRRAVTGPLRNLRNAARNLHSAAQALFMDESPPSDVPDYGEEGPSHPSQMCRCPGHETDDVAEHQSDCAWLAVMCGTCVGTGHCPGCGGDGCGPITEQQADA